MSYPDYTRAERIADGVIHVVGVSGAIVAVAAFYWIYASALHPGTYFASVLYTAAMVFMLSASAAYHMGAKTPARPVLRRIDHAAIYVKIAATLTPLAVLLGSLFGYVVLGFIWSLALFGAMRKLNSARGQMSTEWLPQVILGWLGLALIIPLWSHLPDLSLQLIFAGGLIYSGAVVFYCWSNLKYANAIWHFFVLIATGCCFLGISKALATPVVV
ncbi:MAG: hemolysin III family protein [Pseudomonadota bacterium]